jgi:hypothetical protein
MSEKQQILQLNNLWRVLKLLFQYLSFLEANSDVVEVAYEFIGLAELLKHVYVTQSVIELIIL